MQLNWLIHHTERCLFPLPYMHQDVHQSVCACGVGSPFFFSSQALLSSFILVCQSGLSPPDWLTDWLEFCTGGRYGCDYYFVLYSVCQSQSSRVIHRFMTRCIKLSHSTGRLCIVTDYRMSSALWTWMSAYILLLSFYWLQSADIIAILSTP